MTITSAALERVPERVRPMLIRNRVLVKFGLSGGICFVVTAAINFALKLTVLENKPVTALLIATAFATVLSYILQRGWAFRAAGERWAGEFAVFVLVNVLSMGVNAVPLYFARYFFNLEYPEVGRGVQEVSDFVSGMIIGTLLAMLFRWWGYRRFVFLTYSRAD
ncbi:GtrA family protein [Actinomadura barringtoniae]|uniref:GtrA family protein n=1 Tax=Actinomadura barringtoniae TaxID=1427535 RepID=A0A939T553_9ACTN|nr:GtrA family protein [Actinomadura barringtoniae]MBO2450218.1 GtrA family protein [Actinomadura barringtoniae]